MIVPVLLVGLLIGALVFFIGRLVAYPVRRFDGFLRRRLPRLAAHAATAILVLVVGVTLTRNVVLDPLGEFANERFGAFDTDTPDGVRPPASGLRSGGPGSLVTWDSLGFQGRAFIGGGPTVEELQGFSGDGVAEPIRVYVGLRAADTPQEQAKLAVEELERTGAFDRSVLAVATVTGTGWINPVAADALEYMYGGNTAIVAIQYSYLPSWISFLVDLDSAAESGRALIGAVTERWATLPSDDRPRLLAFGESLGSFGSESAFEGPDAAASVGSVSARVEGALWIGPTFANPIWGQIVDERGDGSPVWSPRFGDGRQVALLGRPDQPPVDGQDRLPPDVVYLTHPSDPVTWADVEALWRRPAWMAAPTGYDVPNDLFWFPGVTALQVTFDLMAGFGAPPGFGHDYTPSIVDGWAALAAPDGWTAEDSMAAPRTAPRMT